MTKTALITGGAGFIGLHLCRKLLKKNFKIIILDNFLRGKKDDELKNLLREKRVKLIKIDLSKKYDLKIKNLSHIFHLAGSVGVKNINKDPLGSLTNNILSLRNVININNNLKKKAKIIVFSTSEVYSPIIKRDRVKFPLKEDNEIIIENKIIDRDSYYISKIVNEKLVQFSRSDYLILRPHNIYGPRMGLSHVIPELIKKFINLKKSKKRILVFSPSHKRAFCYIEDAINQIIRLSLDKKVKNDTFNIGNMKEEVTMFNLAKKIKKIVLSKSSINKGSATLGSPRRRVPDMRKTEKAIRYKKYINLNYGLNKTIEWYLKN
tara:strand:- start:653 stop:1615 length:963 start_codon:yes stop_codon:yes gene_type:complete